MTDASQLESDLARVTALRRAYQQVLDEKGVLEERVRSLQLKEATYLEVLEHQSILLIELEEMIHGKDLVRTPEIRSILEKLWERTQG